MAGARFQQHGEAWGLWYFDLLVLFGQSISEFQLETDAKYADI